MGAASLQKSMGAASLQKSMGAAALYKSSVRKSCKKQHTCVSLKVLRPCVFDAASHVPGPTRTDAASLVLLITHKRLGQRVICEGVSDLDQVLSVIKVRILVLV